MLGEASQECAVHTWHIVSGVHSHRVVGQMSLLARSVQGHEEFDDEITLAGSGRVTPFDEVQNQLEDAADSPEGTATGPACSHAGSGDLPQQAALVDHQWQGLLH